MGTDVIDSALRVHYAPANTKQLLVATSNNRLLKFDARSGKLQTEVCFEKKKPFIFILNLNLESIIIFVRVFLLEKHNFMAHLDRTYVGRDWDRDRN